MVKVLNVYLNYFLDFNFDKKLSETCQKGKRVMLFFYLYYPLQNSAKTIQLGGQMIFLTFFRAKQNGINKNTRIICRKSSRKICRNVRLLFGASETDCLKWDYCWLNYNFAINHLTPICTYLLKVSFESFRDLFSEVFKYKKTGTCKMSIIIFLFISLNLLQTKADSTVIVQELWFMLQTY